MKLEQHLAVLALVFLTNTSLVRSECSYTFVETIPEDLAYNATITSKQTYDGLLELIQTANRTIDIASFYWTLRGVDVMQDPVPESVKGENILNALVNANKQRNVAIRIALNDDQQSSGDLAILEKYAQFRRLNFTRMIGAGILHTKFIVVDGERFYLGSANMDWRSLTHVKELGLIVSNCEMLARDLMKTFEVYWYLGKENALVPRQWPNSYAAIYNTSHPFQTSMREDQNRSASGEYDIYLTSSPKELCPANRTNDIDAILRIINEAQHFICIAVMDYYPVFLYKRPTEYWPLIDDALRRAAVERKVRVRLLASHWNHTRSSMPLFLKSLSALKNTHILKGSIETKLFTVPILTPSERNIPFARVNHNKYMVTDKTAYIGTSNWSADYFVNTAGVGFVANTVSTKHDRLRQTLYSIFKRDWYSHYANDIID